jgi:hypothetical protein
MILCLGWAEQPTTHPPWSQSTFFVSHPAMDGSLLAPHVLNDLQLHACQPLSDRESPAWSFAAAPVVPDHRAAAYLICEMASGRASSSRTDCMLSGNPYWGTSR